MCTYIYILCTRFDRPKSLPCCPYSFVVVIYEIIDYCAGASSAGDNAISLHGTSTPWHRSSRPEFTDPSLSLSLFPLRDAIQYLYTVLITTLIHLLSSPFVRHSGSATGSSNFNEFVSRISIETRKIDSIHADRPVWKESFILYNRFINRYCEITS